MKTQLLIMAAGIGSRFGEGIKQLTPLGPNGEIIMDYSIMDAKAAGFDEVIIVIRKEIEKDFISIVGNRIGKIMPYKIAYQELNDLPEGFSCPSERKKPWGTGHCVLCAKDLIDSPFLVINADDYYGKEGFKLVHDYLINVKPSKILDMCMAGFIVGNTLSDNGTVTRGICKVDDNDNLISVTETYEIAYNDKNVLVGKDENDNEVIIDKNSIVSMNMWGLPKEFIDTIEKDFAEFLKQNINKNKAEFLLPFIVDDKIKKNEGTVKVLKTNDKWYGITYQTDKEVVEKAFKKFYEQGLY